MVNRTYFLDASLLQFIKGMDFPYMLFYDNPPNPLNDEIFRIMNQKLAANPTVVCFHVNWEHYSSIGRISGINQEKRIMSYCGDMMIDFVYDIHSPDLDEMIEDTKEKCARRYRNRYRNAIEFLGLEENQNSRNGSSKYIKKLEELLIQSSHITSTTTSTLPPLNLTTIRTNATQTTPDFINPRRLVPFSNSNINNQRRLNQEYIKIQKRVKASNLLKTSIINLRKLKKLQLSNNDLQKSRTTNIKSIKLCPNLAVNNQATPLNLRKPSYFHSSGLTLQIPNTKNYSQLPISSNSRSLTSFASSGGIERQILSCPKVNNIFTPSGYRYPLTERAGTTSTVPAIEIQENKETKQD